jgi:tetratricopeptide (TPR) repeat protein
MSLTDDAAPDKRYRELYVEAVALRDAARWNEAAERFDAVIASLEQSSEADPDVLLSASYLKIDCLDQRGDGERAVAACDALLARYGASSDPKTVDRVVDALWLKSRALARCGEHDQERTVLQQLIDQYGHETRPQVARAMYNEGIYLRDASRGDEAVQMWDELFSRFSSHPPKSDPLLELRLGESERER